MLSVLLAVLALALRPTAAARPTAVAAATLAAILFAGILASSWDLGWYYILDPVARDLALPFIGFCGAHVAAWLVAAVLAARRS